MIKKTTLLLTILCCTTALFSQNVTYDLRWNADNSNYEFYVKRDVTATAPVTTGGTAAVTIVFPTDGASGTRTVSHTSESVSTFNAAGVIRSPEASSGNDFYVFNSTGGASYIGILNANVEVLWMTFTPSDGNSNARLFINDNDPDSTASGMMGINARSEFNTITTAGVMDEFSTNVLDVATNERSKLLVYPNPASNNVTITAQDAIDIIEVYDLLGKRVKLLEGTSRVDVTDLNSGLFLFKIYIGDNVELRKIVIK